MADWDIHQYRKRLERAKRALQRARIPKENKRLLMEFDKACIAEGLSMPRREKLLRHMVDVAREFLRIPFPQATKKDVRDAVALIEEHQAYSPYTKRDTKIAMRKFFKWLVYGDDALTTRGYPDVVAWIKTTMRRKDMVRVRASDLLTTDDVESLLETTRNPRNRAIIALTYELGSRIGEIGTLRIGDVTRDQYSLLVDLDGKTGKREVRVVLYAGYLVAWLNIHPARDVPSSPMWPSLRPKTFLRPLLYREYAAMIKKAAADAGIMKRVYPHLFRHSRVTHLLASGKINESQAKIYFGWVPDSKILSTYVHLVSKDANDAILRMYGIKNQRDDRTLKGVSCGMCGIANPRSCSFCYRCGHPLDTSSIEESKNRTDTATSQVMKFFSNPEVQKLFKKMVHENENNGRRDGGPPPQASRPEEPTSEVRKKRRRDAA